ncbi:hypothetical protein KR215_011371 [Drosophila sulfurigaster]|uniref:uncharacterized protein LOC133843511 n=1 Tax=Drosophila sulfurigaster albostrigata TaxID=89887 RepID=UPI002D21B1E3|nr:uncharacterized protein LOC133843511 [Drosophila sulfurigaster albostrigata]KAH8389361.1 hypothetical protein KR215_011371 [Drosophila sulfurigaster]
MGVRVIEADSASDSYDDDECPTCKAENKTKTSHPKRATTEASSTLYASRDLVGNCKEYRIENNCRDLRIIGNGNRVRIVNNSGNLQIIGNTTRLKIQHNSGHIKYTGNDGRIYLGSDSQQQNVDYIGCNGLLKVVKSLELNSNKSSKRARGQKVPQADTAQSNNCHKMGVEIDNNVTIVNGVSGSIVIKNAINVSI